MVLVTGVSIKAICKSNDKFRPIVIIAGCDYPVVMTVGPDHSKHYPFQRSGPEKMR